MNENSHLLMINKLLPILETKLTANPNDSSILKQLGGYYRILGNREKALGIFEKLAQIHPDDPYYFTLKNILGGKHPDLNQSYRDNKIPAPIFVRENFLKPEQRDFVFDYTIKHQSKFSQALYYYTDIKGKRIGRVNTDQRDQHNFNPSEELEKLFKKEILPLIPEVGSVLNINYHKIVKTQMEIAVTRNGQYGRPHYDRKPNTKHPLMSKIAFIYYFHKEPKAFKGGDLLLYDTDIHKAEYNGNYTRIIHQDNLLVAYPACFFHEITTVKTDSELLEDSRFAIPFLVQLG